MNYLIIYEGQVYYCSVFDPEYYIENMTVVNMEDNKYTTDGETWLDVEEDTL